MNSIIRTLSLVIVIGSAAYAQQPAVVAPQPALQTTPATDKPKPLAPLLLTKDQVERLADAEKTRQLARAQLQAAQNLLDKIEAQIDGLVKEFQIELRLDPAKYERDLRVLDQQRNAFGFFPKAEPKVEPKPEPKK